MEGTSISPTAYVQAKYQTPPVPTGLVDYGVGAGTPYSYNTTHILATVVLNAPPNATNPSGEGTVDPVSNTGLVGSNFEFSIQLNTIESNVTMPGIANGTLWTQNVVDVNDTGIHFVDDVFNFSYLSNAVFPASGPASIVSGCGYDPATIVQLLTVYGGVYQCVGSTIPISPASYPLTIQLYNNASVNAAENDQVAFGYRIFGAAGLFQTGVSDTVVFNNPAAPAPPSLPVGFEINGFQSTPPISPGGATFLYDSEIIFGGAIGGTNAVFRSINGSLSLQYSNLTSGPWHNIPSAYNFGADTAESATGIVGVWTGNHVENIDQGPSFMYGLWNSLPQIAVASGSIQFQGTVDPTYGFVFVSNEVPGIYDYNMSWVPTNINGGFDTFLPPAIPAGGLPYSTRMYAAGVTEENGTAFSTSQTGYSFPTPTQSAVIRAPLYMWGNAQAASLAHNVTGRALTSTAPYLFSNLVVSLPWAFTHINDYYYPEFTLFRAEGLTTTPVYVNNVVEGTNFGALTLYERDRASSLCGETGGWDNPQGCFFNFPSGYTLEFDIFDSSHARVTNETFYGSVYYGTPGTNGGSVYFFHDTGAYASNITALDGSFGVFNGISASTRAQNLTAAIGANALDDVGSTGTAAWNILAVLSSSFGIYALDSWSGTYTWVNASDNALGVVAGYPSPVTSNYWGLTGAHATTVNELNASFGALGALIAYSIGTTITNVGTYISALGAEAFFSTGTTVTNLAAYDAAGVYLIDSSFTSITWYNLTDPDGLVTYGSEWEGAVNTTLTDANVVNYAYGVYASGDSNTTFVGLNVENSYIGAVSTFDTNIAFTNTVVGNGSFGAFAVVSGTGAVVSQLSATDSEVGGIFQQTTGGTVTGVTSNFVYEAFVLDAATGAMVTTVSVNNSQLGYEYGGVVMASGSGNSVTGVTTLNDSIGVFVTDSSSDTITNVTAVSGSIAVLVDPSTQISVSNVSVSDFSIGVVGDATTGLTIYNVTATNTTLSSPWDGVAHFGGFPYAAIDTYQTTSTIVSDVHATTYPAALWDFDSIGPSVSNLNATSGQYAAILNETYNGVFTDIGAYFDWVGMVLEESASENTVTGGWFVNDTSYGVLLTSGTCYGCSEAYDNTIYLNHFVGDNGATNSYDPAHIQAWSGDVNFFDLCTDIISLGVCNQGIGNYWADWHTYGPNGMLAPYEVTGNSWDYFPIGPAETFTVTFTESGLAAGTTWSVTLGGATFTSATSTITATATLGSTPYSVGSIPDYMASPSSGNVVVTGAAYSVSITFSPVTYAVTLTAGGLAPSTTWSATIDGTTQSTSGTSIVFYLKNGTHSYTFNAVSGYNVGSGATGTLSVVGTPVALSTTYSPVSTPSLASTSDLNNYFAIALAIALIALVIALVALFLRRGGKKAEPMPPPAAWTPPAGAAEGAGAGTTGGTESSGGGASWSEGTGTGTGGGSPPPSS